MLVALVALSLAAAPPPPQPAEISAPLGHFGNSFDAEPQGGQKSNERVVLPKWEGCATQGVYLMRFLLGASRTLEQLQQSLDRGPGAEKKLFGSKKDTLGEVLRQLSASKLEAKVPCKPSSLTDGFKLAVDKAPTRWCDAKGEPQEGEFWFFAAGKPAAVVSVQKGSPDVCKPRLSTVLFDAKGTGRVQIHADWAGAMSTSLLGEKCQTLEFTLNAETQSFVPTWKSCKR